MQETTNSHRSAWRTFLWEMLAVLLFSVLFALITRLIWPGPFILHYGVSLGYGLIGVTSSLLTERYFKQPNEPLQWFLIMLIVVPLGTLLAWWQIKQYTDDFEASNFVHIAIIAGIFCIPVYYYFYSRDKNLQTANQLKAAELKKTQMEKGLLHSELKLLQSQIEPHFLFNTLANIKALITTDPALAEILLDRLTDLLRANLRKSRHDKIRLQDELLSLTSYLEIQKIRLHPRLDFQVNTSPDIDLLAPLPPMLLQPLVENAVVHGIEPQPKGGFIEVNIEQREGNWKITIVDNGTGMEAQSKQPSKEHGLALTNIRQRLQTLFGDAAKLQFKPTNPSGVTVLLELPCEQ